MRGGKRQGAGRKPGSKNRRTLAREQLAIEALKEGLSPLEIMARTMHKLWDAGKAKEACAIAKELAPYVHPRLSSVDTKLSGDLRTYEAQPIPVEERNTDRAMNGDVTGHTQGNA